MDGIYSENGLLRKKRRTQFIFSSIAGIFWGFWSVVFWLPENLSDPELKDFYKLGKWPIQEFAAYVLIMSALLVFAHYLLGVTWVENFNPSKIEDILMGGFVLVFYIVDIVATGGIAIFLLLLIGLVIYLLNIEKKCLQENNIMTSLKGKISVIDTLTLFVIPVFAVVTYAIYYFYTPSMNWIRIVNYLLTFSVQFLLGLILFTYAIIKSLSKKRDCKNRVNKN